MKKSTRNPWAWVPSLYFAEALPYIVVNGLTAGLYKSMGISNAEFAFFTSWLYLPWIIKPLWSPVVEALKTKRWWIIAMQLLLGTGFAGIAFSLHGSSFFQWTLAVFWLISFSSATHDIAADGFYMLGLSEHQQSYFVGIRSTFYRVGMLIGQGGLLILAGWLQSVTGPPPTTIQVLSEPGISQSMSFQPQRSAKATFDTTKMLLQPSSGLVKIGNENIPYDSAQLIFNRVQQWNINHGFYTKDQALNLKPEKNSDHSNGFAVLSYHLTQKPEPGEEVVLNFGFDKGDKSFALKEGSRFVFTPENWNKPAYLIIQADSHLTKGASATFKGTAGDTVFSWSVTFLILAAIFLVLALFHRSIFPFPKEDSTRENTHSGLKTFWPIVKSFFQKKQIGIALAFILLFRLGEAQLVKISQLFLLDKIEQGGLALSLADVGVLYGTIGMLFLTLGGISGGIWASKVGLKKAFWPMALAMNLPNLAYVYLAYVQPESSYLISCAVAFEQFGYGFGFTAFMLYLIYISEGQYKTSHYALCTGFMALGMMLPGMISGWLQELIGYQHFFIWVMLCTLPGFALLYWIKVDPEFGRKR